MTKAQKEIENKIEQMKTALKALGYKEDSWGHMKKESNFKQTATGGMVEGLIRVKFMKTSAKLEIKMKGSAYWRKKASNYYRNIVIEESGRINFGKCSIKAKSEL
jgi:hypothetical protein